MSERYDEIVALALERIPPREIARRTGSPMNTVYHYITKARRHGIEIPRFPGGNPTMPRHVVRVELDDELRDGLLPHAAVRDMDMPSLEEAILTQVIKDGLIDAVLDDGVPDV